MQYLLNTTNGLIRTLVVASAILIFGLGILQSQNTDSRISAQNEIEELIRLSQEASSAQGAIEAAKQAILLADSLGLKEEKARALMQSGQAWISEGNYHLAALRLNNAHDLFHQLQLWSEKHQTIRLQGENFRAGEEYEQALEYFVRAKEYFKETGDYLNLARIYNRIAATYYEMFYKSQFHFDFLLQIKRTGQDPYEAMAEIPELENYYNLTRKYLHSSDSLAIAWEVWQTHASNKITLAGLYSQIHLTDSFLLHINEALDIIEREGLITQKPLALINKSRVLGAEGLKDFERSNELALEVIELAREAGVKMYVFLAAEILQKNYEHQGDYENALEMLSLMWDLNNQFEVDKMKLTMLAMEHDRIIEQRELEIQTRTTSFWIILASAGVFIVISSIYLLALYRKNRTISEKNKKLGQSERKYRMLSENSTDVIWTADLELNLTFCSPNIETFLGYSPEEYMGLPLKETVTPEFYRVLMDHYQKDWSLEDDPNSNPDRTNLLEGAFYTKDGKLKPAELNTRYIRDVENRAIGVIGITRDISERKKAEEKVRQSEAQRTAILESMNDLVLVFDRELKLTEAFAPENDLFMENTENLLGKPFASFPFPADVRGQILNKLEECLETNEPRQLTYAIRNERDQNWFDLRITTIKDKAGRPDGITFVSRDITEQKRSGIAAEEYAEFLNIMLDNMPDYVFVKDKNRKLVRANKKFLTLVPEDQKKELFGQPTYSIFDSNSREEFQQGDKRAFEYGSYETEKAVILPDGEKITVVIKKIRFENNAGEPFILGLVSDITEKKKADHEINKYQRSLELLVEMAKIFINIPAQRVSAEIQSALKTITLFMEADRGGIFFRDRINKSWDTHFSWCTERGNLQDNPWEIDHLDKVFAILGEKISGDKLFISEVESPQTDKQTEEILRQKNTDTIVAVPLTENNIQLGFIAFESNMGTIKMGEKALGVLEVFAELIINVNSRVRSFKELEAATKSAEKANRAKSEFLANMSHEIRTPMNAIIGFAELLKSTGLKELQMKYLQIIHRSGLNLLDIINDILDFSKIEAGKLELEFVRGNLHELACQSLDIIRHTAWKKDIEVVLNVDPKIPETAYFDPMRMRQILGNLLNNAIKFTQEGEIELHTSAEPINENLYNFRFSIRDTGIGIKEEDHTKLFRAFEQVDSTTTRKFGGTGLGLKISSQLVRKMGGKINLRSSPGQGSEFYFDVNFKVDDHSTPIRLNSVKGKTCLIIEPNNSARNVLRNLLVHYGAHTLELSHPNQLNEEVLEKSFDLVFCEKELNGISGFQILSKIAEAKGKNAEIHFVLTTSSLEDFDLEKQCREAGVVYLLNKPVQKYNLLKCLREVFGDPIVTSEEIATYHQPSPENISDEKLTFMVAEDNEFNMFLAKKVIQNHFPNAEIIEAGNGTETYELWKARKPQIILMDVQMPEMDGNETTEKIRLDENSTGAPRTLIIGLTAGAMKDDRQNSIDSGMDEFLTKPLEINALYEAILKYYG